MRPAMGLSESNMNLRLAPPSVSASAMIYMLPTQETYLYKADSDQSAEETAEKEQYLEGWTRLLAITASGFAESHCLKHSSANAAQRVHVSRM